MYQGDNGIRGTIMDKNLDSLTKQINDKFTSCSRNNVALSRLITEATILLTDLSGEITSDAYEEWLDSLILSRRYVEVITNSHSLTVPCTFFRQQKAR